MASLSEQDSKRRKRSLSMLKGVQEDGNLSPDDKILFAETLREVRKFHFCCGSCDHHVMIYTRCMVDYESVSVAGGE